MAKPQWKTKSGLIATIDERSSFSKQLLADDPAGQTLTFSKSAGTLPPGITLSTKGLLSGTPLEVDRKKEYDFVVRTTDGTYSVDRTFTIVVLGSDGPTWTTASGNILTVNNGDYVDYVLQATDQDDTIIEYSIVSGALPDNLTLNKKTGKISGVVAYTPDSTTTYNFTARASDGVHHVDRDFTIIYELTSVADLYWLQAEDSIIGRIKHQNYNVVKVDVYDPGDIPTLSGQTTLRYSLASGSLPPGMAVSALSGEIYGLVPLVYDTLSTYTFTIQVIKSSPLFDDKTFTRQFKIELEGQGANEITWYAELGELSL